MGCPQTIMRRADDPYVSSARAPARGSIADNAEQHMGRSRRDLDNSIQRAVDHLAKKLLIEGRRQLWRLPSMALLARGRVFARVALLHSGFHQNSTHRLSLI